ncbi:MAG: VOC family protein [Pyrinomonadaceae bacterium]
MDVSDEEEGLNLQLPGDVSLFLYPKKDHEPATFTVLNLKVDNIATAVEDLKNRGIKFESYKDPMKTDADGIYWAEKQNHGPNIAWFKDPAQNILSVIEAA